MGKLSMKSQDDLFLFKLKILFDQTVNKLNTATAQNFTFDKFIECFDENDRFTKRLFEFMIKDMAHKIHRSQRASQDIAPNQIIDDTLRNETLLPQSLIFTPMTNGNASANNAVSRSRIFNRMADSFLALTRQASSSDPANLFAQGNRSLRMAAESYIDFHDDDDDDDDDNNDDGGEVGDN